MPHKLRKVRKQRGSRYMGWGQVGQHRKSGGRGGKGGAGGRKHFWIRTVKYEPERYLKKGFLPPSSKVPKVKTINVGELTELAMNALTDYGIKGGNELDLTSMGIGKVLGRGKIAVPLNLKVAQITSSAQEKIEEAGGSIIEP
ncbi:50S ribosomal protein L15 [Candidatus Bathyarchaeota archaeon]|nr:50S ribosomal protein L15 [Candidatus Bathyarchaeota archaeon]MBT4321295.1 50S ribosomal protein L15 [Candidatus Bathyarchaeota archaeon]MBT4424096.1 50S ribosomal protein L15 [Candidatus Bathyarchaeota archaeon]MBT5643158.1 50S ribosomal protein L15 [Candidatus Bathyarchaeota archaeon]MBT6604129.1 50S ribosomal protein L15 [Candidatus Bathyarchaeota archaeon]